MPHTGEQLIGRASELAGKLLRAREDERLVARFVDSYVAEFDRRGLKANPLRYRELLATISREVLLAMVAHVNRELPYRLTRRRPPRLRPLEVQAAGAFSQKFIASLAPMLHWTAAEVEEFQRDLNLYAQLGACQSVPKKGRRGREEAEGPFVDRCALLLDPALLERARHAAGEFLVEIERVTEQILAKVFRSRCKT